MTHTRLVRGTHWVNTAAFIALVVSGVAILMAHPRLYWGENGAFGSPALIDLPWPANLEHSGWGRNLHFLAAWIAVANGSLYTLGGLANPAGLLREARPTRKSEVRPTGGGEARATPHAEARPTGDGEVRATGWNKARPTGDGDGYTRSQRVTYLAVIFVLGPLMLLTGLAMSPAVMAAVPLVDLFGGHQSARTIHGLAAVLLLLFLVVHVVIVFRPGFVVRMRHMMTG